MLVQCAGLLPWILRYRSLPRWQWPLLAVLGGGLVAEHTAVLIYMLGHENALFYQCWTCLSFLLMCLWIYRILQRSEEPRHGHLVIPTAVVIYLGLLTWELSSTLQHNILIAHSLLFAYAFVTGMFAWLLLRLAASSDRSIWRTHEFWTYLAFLASIGPSIPYLGMLNLLWRTNEQLADKLFFIIEVLFLLQFTLLGVAGMLLPRVRKTVTA